MTVQRTKKKTGRKPVHLIAAQKKPSSRDAIWAAIRKQRDFTYASLQDVTDGPKKTISDYVKGLEAAGIVGWRQQTSETGNGHASAGQRVSRMVQFYLIKDCGVHAPRVRKDGSEVTQGRATEAM